MWYLILDNTIQINLRRTANEGLVSILDNNLMHNLAYKYFSVYENVFNTFSLDELEDTYNHDEDFEFRKDYLISLSKARHNGINLYQF